MEELPESSWTSRPSTLRSSSSTPKMLFKLQPKITCVRRDATCSRPATPSSLPLKTSSTPTSPKSCISLSANECSGKSTAVEHASQLLQKRWAWMWRSSATKLAGTSTCRSTRTSSCRGFEQRCQTRSIWHLPITYEASRIEVQQHQLYLKRKEHHACHLMFVARVYKEQVDNARHAHIEQPERALSWHTAALKDLPGYWILLHQCMFGCACSDQDGLWKLVKKPTGILSSKVSMQAALARQCDGQHLHCPLEGSAPGLGRHTSYLEDYQPGLAATIAAAINVPDPAQLWDYGLAIAEQKEVTGCLVKLKGQTNCTASWPRSRELYDSCRDHST